jgi:transcriptional regulator with XRE-family HTH domain
MVIQREGQVMVPSTPDAFGPRLRALRVARGLSLSAFARDLFYSKGYLSRVETGRQVPSAEFALRCDALLEAGGELAALVPADAPRHPATTDHDRGEDGAWMMLMAPDGSSSFGRLGRRELLVGGAAILAAGATGHRPAGDTGANLVLYRRMLHNVRDLGQVSPPEWVLPIVVAQAHALRTVARDARGREALELARLSARTAEYAGWMAQEAGDDAAAIWWNERAAQVAAEAGDRSTAAYALVRRALITVYQGDGAATVEFARRAQADPGTEPRILGLAAQREAQGHALVGDHTECMRALDRAAEWLRVARAEPPSGPVIGTSHVRDPVGVVTGWCLYDLGRPKEAAVVLDREVALIAAGAVRARTRFGVRQALAHAAAGELEHACALAEPMIGESAGLGSATIRTDIRRLAISLRRWSSHPAVRRLAPAFNAALYRAI